MASVKSNRGLDLLNFFLADVRDGIGPFLGVYLLGKSWGPGDISLAMSVSGIATIVAQTPAGFLCDKITHKRALLILTSLLIGLCCVIMAISADSWVILTTQVIIGVCAAFIGPVINAISLGLVGKSRLDQRISRNEAINHFGNVLSAALAGLLGQFFGSKWIFFLVAAMSIGSVLSALWINPQDIDNQAARGCGEASDSKPLKFDSQILFFSLSVILFHFSNAYMLPLLGQVLALEKPEYSSALMSGCILIAQAVMIPVAWYIGKRNHFRRKNLLLIGFLSLPLRALILTLSSDPNILMATQILDGIGAGIFGVVSVLMIADLSDGTGRFNLLQGCIATAVAIGASIGSLAVGQLVESHSYKFGFGFMGVIGFIAVALFLTTVKETRSST